MSRSKYEKWVIWFKTIKDEVRILCHYRFIFDEVQKIIEQNPKIQIKSSFWSFLTSSYASYAAVAVRRLVKAQKDSISFEGLLLDMADNPGDMTVDIFKKLYEGSTVEFMAEHDFKKFSDSSGNILNVDMIRIDLSELQKVSNAIEDFADKRIAHRDKRDLAHTPTFNDLHECIEKIDELACKYQLLLRAVASTSMTPTIQDDWKRIFNYPWIDES